MLLVALLMSTSMSYAGPPDPLKVKGVVHPPAPHVGDTVTLRCQVTPLRGAVVNGIGVGFHGGLLEQNVVRYFEAHGPVIFEYTLDTSKPGEYEWSCSGQVRLDGKPYGAHINQILVVLP